MYEYLDYHKKDFKTECHQIQYWDQCLEYIYFQISILDQLSKLEEETSNSKGNYIAQLSNEYYISCQRVSGEPSNIFYLTQIILDFYIKEITITRTQLTKLNADISNSVEDILKGISYVREKIIQLSHKTMTEVTELMHDSTLTQIKFTKLKTSLDEAQMNKKRLEQNPKHAYNITMKTQAEQKVFEHVQEMESLIPSMKELAKNLEAKKKEFNLIMKDNFEIVIQNTFKNLANLHQFFVLTAKTSLEISTETKAVIHESFNQLTKLTININDFTEKKFAALQGIKYDSIEMINLEDEYTKTNFTQLINASNSVINYVYIFYTCIKMRRALMKRSLKYFNQYKTYEKQSQDIFDKKKTKFFDYINDLKIIGNGTLQSWKILFASLNITDLSQEKTLIINEITDYIIQSKKDYCEMKNKWEKIETKLMQKQKEIEEININLRRKLQDNNRMKPNQIEETINNKIMKKIPRLIEAINIAINFIKTYLACLRDKDINRCTKIIETFTVTVKCAEELFEKKNELFQNEIEHCTQVDLFEECKQNFEQYFNKFNITNYETFLEKIKMKVLIKSDFHKGKLGQKAMDMMNELNTSIMIHNNTTAQLKSRIKMQKSPNTNKMIIDTGNEGNNFFEKEIEHEFEFKQENFISSSDDGFTNNNNNQNNFLFLSEIEDNNYQEQNKSNQLSQIMFIDDKILPHYHKKTQLTFPSSQIEINEQGNNNYAKSKSSGKEDSNTLLNLEDEKIDFINQKYFDIIEHQSPYQNFKGQEIEEYKNKIEDKVSFRNQKDNFQLEDGEHIQNTFYCAFASRILLQGKLYVTNKKLIFDSMFNSSTVIGKKGAKLFIPLRDIIKIEKKTHFLIFDNSIEIHTLKAVLFFTSFIHRDQCAKLIDMSISNLPPEEKIKDLNKYLLNPHGGKIEDDNQDDNNVNKKLKLTKYPRLKKKRVKGIVAMLKEIDFFNRLNQIHNDRLEQFCSFTKNEFYLPHSEFKETFIDEMISSAPPVVISHFLFNPNTTVDEFNHQKSFFESLFIDRKDTNIQLEIDKDNEDIPSFFFDLDYNISLFGNFDKNEIENFLQEIPNWPKVYKYRIQILHPIKKYFIGPDKVNLDNHYYVYYISPKCLVVDDLSYGIGFPFSDTFVSITQYRFNINYEFNEKKGRFQFETQCTISFLVKFIKSCMFAGKIAESGYETACEGIKYYMFDKIKTVVDNQTSIFNEMLYKMSDDTIQKKVICEKEETDDKSIKGNDNEVENNIENQKEKEVQIQSQVIKYNLQANKTTNKSIKFTTRQYYLIIGIIGIIFLLYLKYRYSNDPNKINWIFVVFFQKLITFVIQIKFLFTIDNGINAAIIVLVIWILKNVK